MSSSAEAGPIGAGRRGRGIAARATVGVGAIAVLVLGGRWALRLGGPDPSDPLRVHREDLVLTVASTGELAAVRAVDIGPPVIRDLWDYKIAFLAPESAMVKKGDPVVRFDTQPIEKERDDKKAELAGAVKQIEKRQIELQIALQDGELAIAEAEARLSKARLKAEVPEELREGIEAAEARIELDAAEAEVDSLKAKQKATRDAGEADIRALQGQRDRAKSRLDELERGIEAMTVRAPQDGVLIYKTGWQDDKKKVGDSTWVGEKLLELPDLAEMKAMAEVDEADAGHVAIGQKATIRLEAHPDTDFTGRVRQIGRTVRQRGWRDPSKVYKVEIALDRTDSTRMRPSMRFRGEIETGRIPSLLVAPREAIFLRRGGPVAWVKRGGGYEERSVKLGRSNDRLVEIVSGLAEGDLISPSDLRPPKAQKVGAPMSAGM